MLLFFYHNLNIIMGNTVSELPLSSVLSTGNLTNTVTNLLQQFYQTDGQNTLHSPLGLVSMILPFLGGLSGKTRLEVCWLLGLGLHDDHVDACIRDLADAQTTLTQSGVVKCNSLLLSRATFPLRTEFVEKVSGLCSLNTFDSSNIPQVVRDVNTQVETDTQGMIQNFWNPTDINQDTMFLLLNTLTFSSQWRTPFERSCTKKRIFYGSSGQRMENLMTQTARFVLYETMEEQVLSIPFQQKEFSFLVVLPRDKESKPLLPDLSVLLHEMQRESVRQEMSVTLPTFTVEKELDLIPFFKHHDVEQLFFDMQADIMTSNTDTKYISVLKQKIKMVVNEEGTEAAAATVAICDEECDACEPEPTAHFMANRPFTYYIIHEPLQLALFAGTFE
jgi:serpin B